MADNANTNTQDIEALTKERDALSKEAAQLEAKNAALREELANFRATKKDGLGRVNGSISISLEDPKTGKKSKKKITVTPGHPYIRLRDSKVVSSQLLMDLATGKLSGDELEKYPDLKKLGKDGAIEYLSELAAKKSGFLTAE